MEPLKGNGDKKKYEMGGKNYMLMLLCSLANALQMSAFARTMFVYWRNIAFAPKMFVFIGETLCSLAKCLHFPEKLYIQIGRAHV